MKARKVKNPHHILSLPDDLGIFDSTIIGSAGFLRWLVIDAIRHNKLMRSIIIKVDVDALESYGISLTEIISSKRFFRLIIR